MFLLGDVDYVGIPAPDAPNLGRQYRWSPDGSGVLVDQRHVFLVDSLEVSEFGMPGLLRGWSPDGQSVWLYEPGVGHVLRVKPDGSNAEVVAEVMVFESDPGYGPFVSADGQRIAWYGQNPHTADSTGLFVQDLPDGQPRAVDCEGADPATIIGFAGAEKGWSVDGRSFFWSKEPCNVIYRCDIGTGTVEVVARATQNCIGYFRQSPNGRYLAYDTQFPALGVYDLFAVDLGRGDTMQFTDGWGTALEAWTHDSKYILFNGSDWHGLSGYFKVSVPGGEIRQVGLPRDADQHELCGLPLAACPVARSHPALE